MKNYHPEQGFTLIELLVVIFIISIVTSVALLTVSRNRDKQLESFVDEFKQIIILAEEQAILQPMIIGLSFHESSFQFASYQPAVGEKKAFWAPLQDAILRKYDIPNGIQLSFATTEQSQEPTTKKAPQVVISTNGDLTPFKIYVGHPGENPRYVIRGETDGAVISQQLS